MPTRRLEFAALAATTLLCVTSAKAQSPYGIGQVATPAEIAGWNIDVGGDGRNLAPGTRSARPRREGFAQQCRARPGPKGPGGVGRRPPAGQGATGSRN